MNEKSARKKKENEKREKDVIKGETRYWRWIWWWWKTRHFRGSIEKTRLVAEPRKRGKDKERWRTRIGPRGVSGGGSSLWQHVCSRSELGAPVRSVARKAFHKSFHKTFHDLVAPREFSDDQRLARFVDLSLYLLLLPPFCLAENILGRVRDIYFAYYREYLIKQEIVKNIAIRNINHLESLRIRIKI